ncbi:YdbH domain-containing protein [Stutzerimonas frequens]|uniref:YdbH domain-containing protein n=1 Tax=Stutzerimonas frequens TaxID=2968969 RepID=UPI001AAE9698|nr:YdbH domain-containing protein [Stutzerimonas frequens]QTF55616.1 YdbH domain-containing protein [Stutzerimonas frequens]
MTKPWRTVLLLCVGLLALLPVLAAFAWHQWQGFKHEQGIEQLDWQGLWLSSSGISAKRVRYIQAPENGPSLATEATNITLDLASLFHPLPPRSLHIEQLELDIRSFTSAGDSEPPATNLEQYERWAAWLPQRLTIADLRVSLPCAKGRCDERGALRFERKGESLLPLAGRLDLRRNEHRLSLIIDAQSAGPAESLILATLAIDDQPRLEARHQLDHSDRTLRWNGTLSVGSLPEAPWLLHWLGEWTATPTAALPDMPTDMRIGAGWALALAQTVGGTYDWSNAAGELRLSAHIPAAWPVIGLGELQGDLDLAARGQDGLWLPTELKANLQLRPASTLLPDVPAALRPSQLNISVEPIATQVTPGQLPVQLRLETQGGAPSSLQARMRLATAPPYSLDIEQARLQTRSTRLQLDALTLQNLDATLDFSGRADLQKVELQLQKSSQAKLALLATGEVVATQLSATLPRTLALQIERNLEQPTAWRTEGPLELRLSRLEHPLLLAQGWRWSGQLKADSTALDANGSLSNDAGLTMALNLEQRWNGPLQVGGKLQEIFLRAGNPIAGSLAAWPASLELSSGRLSGDGKLTLPAGNGKPTANLTLEARGLAGIFDRSEISGLDARLTAQLRRDRLRLDVSELRLVELNPGFTFGPLLLRGHYEAAIDQPAKGRLTWQIAETQILGGRFWLPAGALDLAAPQQRLSARLEGVQLGDVLAAYPTEGLSGSGVIDGSFDVQRSAEGLSVRDGKLAARAPGGVLRFRSPKIEALGQANPAMKIVTEALHDFHYDLLTSDVRYDENGKLNLGLRLNGHNPALEGGRPINFSINLEEDIPALLTSLQLSDRVSETIQRRVQERLRQGNADPR